MTHYRPFDTLFDSGHAGRPQKISILHNCFNKYYNFPVKNGETAVSVINLTIGPGKSNHREDVIIVQRLLNKHLAQLTPLKPLRLDGRWGPRIDEAIRLFQSRVVHLPHPDGCIDPHGPTLNQLTAGANQKAPVHHVPFNVNAFVAMQ